MAVKVSGDVDRGSELAGEGEQGETSMCMWWEE